MALPQNHTGDRTGKNRVNSSEVYTSRLGPGLARVTDHPELFGPERVPGTFCTAPPGGPAARVTLLHTCQKKSDFSRWFLVKRHFTGASQEPQCTHTSQPPDMSDVAFEAHLAERRVRVVDAARAHWGQCRSYPNRARRHDHGIRETGDCPRRPRSHVRRRYGRMR